MDELLETLRSIELLKGISAEELLQIASISEQIAFLEDAIIFRENTPAENLYLVLEGNISLEICAPSVGCRRILTVGKGELLGWSPVLEKCELYGNRSCDDSRTHRADERWRVTYTVRARSSPGLSFYATCGRRTFQAAQCDASATAQRVWN